MPRHPALQSLVFLRRTFVAYHPKHQRYDVIATVGEALALPRPSPRQARRPPLDMRERWPLLGAPQRSRHRTCYRRLRERTADWWTIPLRSTLGL